MGTPDSEGRMRACGLIFLTALVATHALDEGFVEVLDDSPSEHLAEDIRDVVPFLDADELIQLQGMVRKANSALQSKLASDAQTLHRARLEVEKAASSANLKYTKADATAQAATQAAMSSKKPSDADKAVKLKQEATKAKTKQIKLQKDQSDARIKADAALKKAQESGATIKLPTLSTPSTSTTTASTSTTASSAALAAASAPVTAPVVPSSSTPAAVGVSNPAPPPVHKPEKLLPDPPGITKKKEPSKLEILLKQRKKKREKREAHTLRKKYEEAKVEKQQEDYVLSKKMAKFQKIKTKEAESQSAKSAARKKQQLDEANIIKAHIAVNLARTDYKQTKKAEKLTKARERELGVEEEVDSTLAKTGDARRNLKKAEKERAARNENLKTTKANIVSTKLALEKANAATVAAKAALTSKQDALKALHRRLRKVDGQFASAVYSIKQLKSEQETAQEDKDQAVAEDKLANKKYKESHALATAAALTVNGSKDAKEKTLKALVNDPKEAKKEALLKIKDQDGISDLGTSLVAAKGAIAKSYVKQFNKLPLPRSGRNPILDAEAKASVRDDAATAALKVATTPGPATIAAAKNRL